MWPQYITTTSLFRCGLFSSFQRCIIQVCVIPLRQIRKNRSSGILLLVFKTNNFIFKKYATPVYWGVYLKKKVIYLWMEFHDKRQNIGDDCIHRYMHLYYTLRFYFPYLSLLAQPVTIFVYGPARYLDYFR